MYKSYNRIVIGVDPAVTQKEDSDETGIIVAGIGGRTGKAYVLADLSGRYTPSQWSKIIVGAYYQYSADRVVAEVNQGGDMVEHTLRVVDPAICFKGVHATRGKHVRAEPIAALYEKGEIFHIHPFPELEEQMLTYTPIVGKSPDRVDALVWAMTELCLDSLKDLPRAWVA